jgi:hypothetical protein
MPAWVATPVGRLLLPSFADFFFIALMVWMFLAGPHGWSGLMADGDAGWHIRTGEYILDQHVIPSRDLFSYSKPGETWYAWEWLSDVVFAGLYRAFGGLKGPALLAGVILALYPLLMARRAIWSGANAWFAIGVTLVAVGASSIHFLARPHIFTLLLLAIAVWMIQRDLVQPDRRIWLLALLTVLWTNLHGGFPILIALLGLTAVGTLVEAWWNREGWWRRPVRYLSLAAACLAASVINPFGIGVHLHIVQYLRSDWIRNVIQEFQASSFRNESALQFEVLLFAGLLCVPVLLGQRRITEALWIGALAHFALSSQRHIPIYAIVAAPLIAVVLTRWWDQLVEWAGPRSTLAIFDQVGRDTTAAFCRTSVWGLVFVVWLAVTGAPIAWPKDFPDKLFPTAIVAEHGELLRSGRVFTVDQWADYLIYRHYPNQKVFVDGRSDFYGPTIGNEYLRLSQGQHDWRKILDKWRFDVALVQENWPLATLLKADPAWEVLADDGRAILLKKKR